MEPFAALVLKLGYVGFSAAGTMLEYAYAQFAAAVDANIHRTSVRGVARQR
jgi:adenine-specific DNA glycosylase